MDYLSLLRMLLPRVVRHVTDGSSIMPSGGKRSGKKLKAQKKAEAKRAESEAVAKGTTRAWAVGLV